MGTGGVALRVALGGRHEEWGPGLQPESIQATRQVHRDGSSNIYGEVRVRRDYEVRIYALRGDTPRLVEWPRLLRANVATRFKIERWGRDQNALETSAIAFRFWPATNPDLVPAWSCPCWRRKRRHPDRDPGEPASDPGYWRADRGHWEWPRIPVVGPDHAA
jgi:hypothetical protein